MNAILHDTLYCTIIIMHYYLELAYVLENLGKGNLDIRL